MAARGAAGGAMIKIIICEPYYGNVIFDAHLGWLSGFGYLDYWQAQVAPMSVRPTEDLRGVRYRGS